jgi:hypothetical protein
MSFLRNQKQISSKYLVGLSVAILFGIFFFGLKLNGFYFSNGVNWITDQPGICFSNYGIAYTKPFIGFSGEGVSDSNGFSVEIALKPSSYREKGSNIILEIYSGKENNNLFLTQVRQRMYLVSGNDYDLNSKQKIIRVNLYTPSPKTQFITITTGKRGSAVYLNGQLVRTKKDLTLQIPNGSKARLIIGNSVYGKHSWQGDVYGLALYRNTLTAPDIKLHFTRWLQDQNFSFAKKYEPLALYFFDEKEGVRALDHGTKNHHLEIPLRMQIFKKKILSLSWSGLKFRNDIILNLLGFMPFGFILAATFIKFGGTFEKHYILITVSFCFTVSLIIELVQAWIPSRSSTMLDLILNTLGALIGVIILRFSIVWIFPKRALEASN